MFHRWDPRFKGFTLLNPCLLPMYKPSSMFARIHFWRYMNPPVLVCMFNRIPYRGSHRMIQAKPRTSWARSYNSARFDYLRLQSSILKSMDSSVSLGQRLIRFVTHDLIQQNTLHSILQECWDLNQLINAMRNGTLDYELGDDTKAQVSCCQQRDQIP